jgi:hypothetical protein
MEIFVELPFLFRAPIHVLILQSTSEPTGTRLVQAAMHSKLTIFSQLDEDFISKVRRRYMRCCLTGKEVPHDMQNTPNFAHFKVARIFPLSAKNEVCHN